MTEAAFESRPKVSAAVSAAFAELHGFCDGKLHELVVGAAEAQLIRSALDYHQGNQVRVSAVLGINRNTLRKRMREYGIATR